jgi:hypothetical protein
MEKAMVLTILTARFCLDAKVIWSLGKISKECGAQPTFNIEVYRVIPIAVGLVPQPWSGTDFLFGKILLLLQGYC